jgi:hypothetical protein
MTRTQTTRERLALAEWQDAITSNVGTETRHGDRARDDIGAMRAIVWCAVIGALLMVSSCVVKTRLTLAHADTGVSVVLHGLSWHETKRNEYGHEYNARNLGLGLRLDTHRLAPHTALQAGRYRNSYWREQRPSYSNYLIADYTPLRAGAVQAGAFAGVVTGYPWQHHTFAPAGGLTASIHLGRAALALRAGWGKHAGTVAALELGVRL